MSRPLADAFEVGGRAKLTLMSQEIKLADAIRYALSRQQGLTCFTDDGRMEFDDNMIERSIRGIKLSRNKTNDLDPLGYLTDFLTRIVNGIPSRGIDQLHP